LTVVVSATSSEIGSLTVSELLTSPELYKYFKKPATPVIVSPH